MAHFAHVKNNIVDSVIVIDDSLIVSKGGWQCPECGVFIPLSEWVQTSYNTHEGIHSLGGTPLRKNFAGKGCMYDSVRDAFIPPQPFPSWILNEDTCNYEPPVPKPSTDISVEYPVWDEESISWKIKTI